MGGIRVGAAYSAPPHTPASSQAGDAFAMSKSMASAGCAKPPRARYQRSLRSASGSSGPSKSLLS